MVYYTNAKSPTGLAAVEFVASPKGDFTFFYCANSQAVEATKAQLGALGQNFLAETPVGAQVVVIAQGGSQDAVLQALKASGEQLSLTKEKHPLNRWKLRGYLSDIGMALTLISAKVTGQALDLSKAIFAGMSLSANMVNKIYGAQQESDPHRLAFLEQKADQALLPLMRGPAVPQPEQPPKEMAWGERAQGFIRRHSVRFGEIGLRYLGSVVMVLSPTQFRQMGQENGEFSWKRAIQTMSKQSPKAAFGLLNKDKTNLATGLIYTVGRTSNFIFSKTPDPYDPQPKTAFDDFREKYSFKLSSAIEASAAATLAAGSYKKRDWIGTLGGAAVSAGLITRMGLPFGVRVVDMDKLYAHVAGDLAAIPAEGQTKAVAHAAALLKENLADQPTTFGQLFTGVQQRLENAVTLPSEPKSAVPFTQRVLRDKEPLAVSL